MKDNNYPPKGEIWSVNVIFKADKKFWGTDTLKDFAYCSWNDSENCYIFHTMAYGYINEKDVISFDKVSNY